MSPDTLAKWAVLGIGPKYTKMGSGRSARVRYKASELERFMNDRQRGGEAA